MCSVFRQYFTGKIFSNVNFVLLCFLQIPSEKFLVLRIIRRDTLINKHRCSYKVPSFLSHFNELIFPQRTEKCWKTKFSANPFGGSRIVPCGRTDKYDEANFRILQFFERPLKPGDYFKILNVRDRHTKTSTNSLAIQPLTFRHFLSQKERTWTSGLGMLFVYPQFILEPPNRLSHNMNVMPLKVSPMPHISFSYIR